MTIVRGFPKGGIQPHDDKFNTADSAIWNAALPALCVVPLHQHKGPVCERIVEPGAHVTEGMMIGRASADGAHVHSPVPGIVRRIRSIHVPECGRCEAVVIELSGAFSKLGKSLDPHDWRAMARKDVVAQLRDLGLVELSGTPHPLHRSLQYARRAGVARVVVNGAESAPYISGEDRLMQEHSAEVVVGAQIIAHLLHTEDIVFAVGSDKKAAARSIRRELLGQDSKARVMMVGTKYPQGAVPQLLRSLQRKEIPYGKDERELSCFVLGAATAYAVAEAVLYGKPCVERVITVAGGGIVRPGNVKVRLGTSFAELIQECGGFSTSPVQVVSGDPLTGYAVNDLTTPVSKTTRAIVVLTESETGTAVRRDCIGCGRCVRACPIGLEPNRLFKLIEHDKHAKAVAHGLNACTECGCCSYVCPSRLPLMRSISAAKSERLSDYHDNPSAARNFSSGGGEYQ